MSFIVFSNVQPATSQLKACGAGLICAQIESLRALYLQSDQIGIAGDDLGGL
jgi:hypothetical protein